jgi:hypothetical protein
MKDTFKYQGKYQGKVDMRGQGLILGLTALILNKFTVLGDEPSALGGNAIQANGAGQEVKVTNTSTYCFYILLLCSQTRSIFSPTSSVEIS